MAAAGSKPERDQAWFARWMASACRTGTMSQCKRTAIDAHGGLERAVEAARAEGVHLVLLTDDHGDELVAASLHPFRVLA